MKLYEEFKLYENMWDRQPIPKHKGVHSVKLAEKLDIAELATRGDRSQAIVGDDPYNGDMLYLKDLNELAEYATIIFGETNGDKDMASHTPMSFRLEVLEDSDVKMSAWVRKALEAAINSPSFTLLRDSMIGDPSAHMQIKNIMETLHYDNGKPLSCKEYDFFSHHDRDQDFWGFYEDELIYDFITDGKDLYVRIDMSFEDLEDQLTYTYDGASWDHDFNKSLKEAAPGWREYEITYSFDSALTETHTDIIAAKIEEDEDKIIDRFFDSLFDSGYDEDIDGIVDVIDIKPL